MISLDELCTRGDPLTTTSDSLHQACALPRTPADMAPLPEPRMEVAFDSSWEALLTGNDAIENWAR